jgi:hypothetical protein
VDVAYASWLLWESRPDVLLYSTRVLLINVKRSQLDINQGGLNLRVTHELHERGQTHTGRIMSEANVWRLCFMKHSRHYAPSRTMPPHGV